MFVMASRKFNKINKDYDRHAYFNVIDPFMVEQNISNVWKNSFFFHSILFDTFPKPQYKINI